MEFLYSLYALSLEAAPWLLLGLLVAGLIKAFMNETWLAAQLGGNGLGAIVKAALIGTPLPLCSCSVIPVAMGIRRSGASKSSTVSFLIATPETGADSIALSYAMLGPLMAIVRPIAAVASAVTSGLLVTFFDNKETAKVSSASETTCCSSKKSCCDSAATKPENTSVGQRLIRGVRFAFTDIFDDFIVWLAIGLVFAALVKTFVPESFLLEWGSGLPAMIVMLLVGIPMYICATASTPIAAALIAAGISPGTALVFLLAGPATNMATLAVISQELGRRALVLYLAGMAIASIASGLVLDAALAALDIDILSQLAESQEILPLWLSLASLLLLVGLSLLTIRRKALV